MKGCPYDNAIAEATFKMVKTEFVSNQRFESLQELQYELVDYVNWFNNHRIDSSLDYLTLVACRVNTLKKMSSLLLTIQLESLIDNNNLRTTDKVI